MWYEIIPSFVIITTVLAVPHGAAYILNWLVTGNLYRRRLNKQQLRFQYLRDRRLTGDAYVCAGLENIPLSDEEEQCPDEDDECSDE